MRLTKFLAENKLTLSQGEARRLICQGAVKVDDQLIDDMDREVRVGEKVSCRDKEVNVDHLLTPLIERVPEDERGFFQDRLNELQQNNLLWRIKEHCEADLRRVLGRMKWPVNHPSLYGSRVYGTAVPESDWDIYLIVSDSCETPTGTEFREGKTNIQVVHQEDFRKQIEEHKPQALEVWFNDPVAAKIAPFKLDLTKLRHSFSQKASHSFVKAQKKIEVEREFLIGFKSLFHSLRILKFGIEIADTGMLTDFQSANHYWGRIMGARQYEWSYFKEHYQPEYNRLATEFRLLAPKE